MKNKSLPLLLTVLLVSIFLINNTMIVRSESSYGVISGKIGEIVEISSPSDSISPVIDKDVDLDELPSEAIVEYKKGVRVYVILTDSDDFLSSKCAFTDENGEYFLSVPEGSYNVKTDLDGYNSSSIEKVNVSSEEEMELDIAISQGQKDDLRFFPLNITKYKDMIESKVESNAVGSEFSVQIINESVYKKTIVLYDDILIDPINVTAENVTFQVNGEEYVSSKTIVLYLENGLFNMSRNLTIRYDGFTLNPADDLDDVLNPDDDGSNPEYLFINSTNNGSIVLVSIPHFSQHKISIFTELPAIILPPELEDVIETAIEHKEEIVAIGIIIIVFAAFLMFRKSKDEL